jgi:hypothetical protein
LRQDKQDLPGNLNKQALIYKFLPGTRRLEKARKQDYYTQKDRGFGGGAHNKMWSIAFSRYSKLSAKDF